MKKLLLLLVLALCICVAGASGNLVQPAQAATPGVICDDGIDNDGDGYKDYTGAMYDPGCTSQSDSDEYNATVQCTDGIDNDNDGKKDFFTFQNWNYDQDCESQTDNSEGPVYACSDHIDNDNDGYVDYPADFGCNYTVDNTETNTQCDDKLDNDGDGKTDMGVDPGCTSYSDNSENSNTPPPPPPPTTQCNDSIDNDDDGLNNHPNDPGCTSTSDDTESPNPPVNTGTVCDNGIDDDGDTYIDFDGEYGASDIGCYSKSDTDEGNVAQCSDGVDNDNDEKIDTGGVQVWPSGAYALADDGCSNPWDDQEFMEYQPTPTYEFNSIGFEGDPYTCEVSAPCAVYLPPISTSGKYACWLIGTPPTGSPFVSQNSQTYCNGVVKSITIRQQFYKSIGVDTMTFNPIGAPLIGLDLATFEFEQNAVVQCVFYGQPQFSRTWFVRVHGTVVFPNGIIKHLTVDTKRKSIMCDA